MFKADGRLYYEAFKKIKRARNNWLNCKATLCLNLTDNDTVYQAMKKNPYYDECLEIVKSINVQSLVNKVGQVKNKLMSLDDQFTADYRAAKADFKANKLANIFNIETFPSFTEEKDYDNNFEELSDMNYTVSFGLLSHDFGEFVLDYKNNIGKKLSQLNFKNKEDGLTIGDYYSKLGIGEFVISDVIEGNFGCKILVLQDKQGNYTMVFPSTANPSFETSVSKFSLLSVVEKFLSFDLSKDWNDIVSDARSISDKLSEVVPILDILNNPDNYDMCYDLYPLIKKIGIDSMLADYDNESALILNDALFFLNRSLYYKIYCFGKDETQKKNKLDDGSYTIFDYLKKVYDGQRLTVKNTVLDYYDKAKTEGVQLNFYGFSKGGGQAELAYLTCNSKILEDISLKTKLAYKITGNDLFYDKESYDVLGDLVVYNPYHDSLGLREISILEKSGDLTVYRNQGDFVSTIFNENCFDENTIFIKCDWESCFKSILDVPKLVVDGPHNIESIFDVNGLSTKTGIFDEKGNVISVDENGNIIDYSYSSDDILTKIFGSSELFSKDFIGKIEELKDADSDTLKKWNMFIGALRALNIYDLEDLDERDKLIDTFEYFLTTPKKVSDAVNSVVDSINDSLNR